MLQKYLIPIVMIAMVASNVWDGTYTIAAILSVTLLLWVIPEYWATTVAQIKISTIILNAWVIGLNLYVVYLNGQTGSWIGMAFAALPLIWVPLRSQRKLKSASLVHPE